MPPVTPTSNVSPRHRHGAWSKDHPPSYYDYENVHYTHSHTNASPRAPPPPGYYPHYVRGSHPHDYWANDHGNGYYDGQPGPEREPQEMPRAPREGTPYRPHYPYHGANSDNRRSHYGIVPSSPREPFSQAQMSAPQRDYGPPRGYVPDTERVPKEKRNGDPLSILANVSAGMTGKDGQNQKNSASYEGRRHVPIPAPTSPLQRRNRPSPITPNHTPQDKSQRVGGRHMVNRHSGRPQEQHPHWDYIHDANFEDYPPEHGYSSPRRRGAEYPPPYPGGAPPVLVERGSFDSQGEMPPCGDIPPFTPKSPPDGHYYADHPPTFGYWDSYAAHAPPAHYPPPRWRYGMQQESFHPEYNYDSYSDRYSYPRPPMPLSGQNAAPYTYVQQPRLEEKTILRKKFSWKHYPELERFLIANRDEYLKHSNMNYTAEQKQYNNWLTERLLEVASRHNYVFDPDDFNFVAIRDRIRCYYKSYVQTARKRGLKLPEKKDS